MGFLDRFRSKKHDVHDAKVLICSVGDGFADLLAEDTEPYRRYLDRVTVMQFSEVEEFIRALSTGFEVVHACVQVTPDGFLGTSQITGTDLIKEATTAGTKLLWIANGNDASGYIKNFKPNGNKLNLVMTIDRRGYRASAFLAALLREMQEGASMPIAWNRAAPQGAQEHTDAPASIFFCGLGHLRFV